MDGQTQHCQSTGNVLNNRWKQKWDFDLCVVEVLGVVEQKVFVHRKLWKSFQVGYSTIVGQLSSRALLRLRVFCWKQICMTTRWRRCSQKSFVGQSMMTQRFLADFVGTITEAPELMLMICLGSGVLMMQAHCLQNCSEWNETTKKILQQVLQKWKKQQIWLNNWIRAWIVPACTCTVNFPQISKGYRKKN